MASIIEISDLGHFQRTLQTAGPKLVVVDFTATWCGPCRMIAPTFAALADEYAGRALFLKVDVDAASDVSSFCSVSSMPTFHGYKAASIVFNFSGADRARLTSEVARHAPSSSEASPFAGAGHSLGGGPPKVDWDYVSPEERRRQAAAAAAARFGGGGSSAASADKPKPEPAAAKQPPSSKAAAAAVNSLLASDQAAASAPAPDAAPSGAADPVTVAGGVNSRMLAALLEMGFPRPRAVRALHATSSKSSEAAMDWCFEHSEDVASNAPLTAQEDVVAAEDAPAAGSGDVRASGSQLTPAEREAKAAELLRKARAKRTAEERAAEIEREKARVREGKEMIKAKAELAEQQRRRVIEERRREKREQVEERNRIRARIAADKAARMEKFNMPGAAAGAAAAAAAAKPAAEAMATRASASAPPAGGKIQFRLPDGARIEGAFGPDATLAQAAGFVARERPDLAAGAGFCLASMYPKKVFGEPDMSGLLAAAGLLPRGALNVQKL